MSYVSGLKVVYGDSSNAVDGEYINKDFGGVLPHFAYYLTVGTDYILKVIMSTSLQNTPTTAI
jgi:hypothetical protein